MGRVVPGIAPPGPPSPPTTPGTPCPTDVIHAPTAAARALRNMVVGLISVAQLTCRALFSGFRGITEVYNLVNVGRIINHSLIPGNK